VQRREVVRVTDMVLVVVGVRPETTLAAGAGAELGVRGAIAVDTGMRTNLPDVFAAGDCVVTHHRLFDPVTVESAADDHKAYYPGSHRIAMRVTGDRVTGRLLGLQLFGRKDAEIAKRIDIAATALRALACSGDGRSRVRAADESAEAGQLFGPGPVVDPDAALLAVQQPGLVQDLQVMADRRLGQVERVVEVADAGLAAGVGGHQGHQPQPYRLGERLQQRGNLLGLGLGQRPGRQRRAAHRRVSGIQHHQRLRHTSILTDIDVRGKLGNL